MKKTISALVFAIAIIVAAVVLGNAFINRNKAQQTISVTGLGEADFTSDLIVWEARYTRMDADLSAAYADLERDKMLISEYLRENGIDLSNVVFSAVNTSENNEPIYGDNGNYLGSRFTGYTLSQTLEITSKEVEKIERISREITQLLNQGVQLYSLAPRYYFTQIEDLKIEMIARATENARLRAEQIAENSGAELGELISGDMGVFQITGQNSGEDYSWGGAYNTASKEKTTSITMKLKYNVD
ncbi:MAG: SIMPL domain-containing protein [Flavobacteriaceae bacterium]|nr:SIMPL domain-containing protein [Flavobacteriaceae bacterium]